MARRGQNEGSIRHRADGRWEARLTLADGRRKSVFGKTRQEAAKKLLDVQKAQADGLPVVSERQTVGAFLIQWLDTVRPTLRPRTWERYSQVVNLHIVPALGKEPLVKLTPVAVQKLYAAELGRGASPRTVIKLHMVLRRALSQAVRWGLVPRNVADLVDPPSPVRKEMQTFSPEEARALLAAAKGDRLEALYVLALTTGMRQGELLALHWRDVDLDAGAVMVRGSLGRTKDGLLISAPKNNRTRRIELTEAAIIALRRHRVAQAEERLSLGAGWDDQDLVFPNAIGRPIEARNLLSRSYAPLLKRANVPALNFHALRHTAATLMLMQGIHPKVVSEMLGHSQISITLDIYSHVIPTMQKQATAAMDALLGSATA
jgi:integrase